MHDNDYGFGNIFRIIWKKKKFIILVVSFVTVSSIVVSLLLPKWYKATAIILPPSQAQPMLGSIALLGNLGMGDLLGGAGSQNRYLSILKSRTLLQEVANKFNLKEIYGCENIEDLKRTTVIIKGKMREILEIRGYSDIINEFSKR